MSVEIINVNTNYKRPNHMKDLQKMLTNNNIPYDVIIYGTENDYYKTTFLYYPNKEFIKSSITVIENVKDPYKNKRLTMNGLIEPGLRRKVFGGKQQKRLTAEIVFARLKFDWDFTMIKHQLIEKGN